MKRALAVLLGISILVTSGAVFADWGNRNGKGLNFRAKLELIYAGVPKYIGRYRPASSMDIGEGWVKHTYDPGYGGGPMCIVGSPYSVFTKIQNPEKLLIMLQGGGACWQDFYFCNIPNVSFNFESGMCIRYKFKLPISRAFQQRAKTSMICSNFRF